MELGGKRYLGLVIGLLLLLGAEAWGYASLTPQAPPVTNSRVEVLSPAELAVGTQMTTDARAAESLLRRRAPSAPGTPIAAMLTTNSAQVSWKEPDDLGRGHFYGYSVSANGGAPIATMQTSLVMGSLSPGVAYSFVVQARGEVGWGPPSAASAALILPKIRPGLEGVVWTFDDCEYAATGNVFHLLDILQKHGVQPGHAIFFYIGWCYYAHQDEIAKIKADGYEVGNHTATHAYLPGLSYGGIQAEIAGGPPGAYWFRPPYGAYDSRVNAAVAAAGLHMMLWNKTAGDTSTYKPALTCQSILNLFWDSGVGGNDNVLSHMFHVESGQAIDAYLSGSHSCDGY
jgi:peptidoglycan/xylan/chitin deacetylase (PgdA/CDA1 family)